MSDTEQDPTLPKWARDRLKAEKQMGDVETTAPPAAIIGSLLGMGVGLGIILAGCVVIYLIGRALVGP